MNLGYISRKGGRSATAHSAYIACTTLEEERTGLVFDYSKKQGLLGQGILAPEDCPEWVYDKQMLRNAVESFEDQIAQKRFRGHTDPIKNAKSLERKEKFLETCKTGYTANFALPLEIENPSDLLSLSERIIKECYVKNGLITEWAVHYDKGNPHLHILAVTRPWKEDNFSETRFVIEREQLLEIRHLAAETTNKFGQEKGYNYHVDARSYEDRGLTLLPSRHLGSKAYHKHKEESRIAQENNEIHQQNLALLLDHPEEIVKLVATQKVVFTQADIEREIFKRAGGDMHFYNLLKSRLEGMEISSEWVKTANDNVNLKIKEEDLKADYEKTLSGFATKILHGEEGEVVEVGKNLRDVIVFTTKQALELEKSITADVERMKSFEGKEIPHAVKEASIALAEQRNGFAFSEEQRAAIDYLLDPEGLRVLTGKAGTGKTTVLRPVVDAYREAGYILMGTAFQGKVSDLLAHDLEIPSYTLDQLRYYWGRYDELKEEIPTLKGKALTVAQKELERVSSYQLTPRHVIFLDEGNMVGGNLWQGLLSRVQGAGAHLRVVQDNNQIKALYGADISRLVEEKVGCFDLNEVHRQKEEWMRQASASLNSHDNLIKGIKAYEEHGCLTFKESAESTRYALAEAYVNNWKRAPHEFHMALAFQNPDVSDLNAAIHHQLKQMDVLGKSFVYKEKEFSVGDRIVFTENDHTGWFVKTIDSAGKNHQKGVKNGSFGEIKSIDEEHSQMEVALKDGRHVLVNLKTYDHIEYGYAMTVNKAEGHTFDHVYGWFDHFMSTNKALIWMTRHRLTFQGFISGEQAVDVKAMVEAVGRSEYRPLISDFGESPEADLLRKYLVVAYEAGKLWGVLSRESTETSTQDQPEWVDFQAAQHERNRLAEEILENWEGARTFAHQVGLKKATLEVQSGLKMRELSTVELEALQRVETYRSISIQARSLWEEISRAGNLAKTHPRMQDYEALCQNRNQLAYDIASFPEIHKPFFKTTDLATSLGTGDTGEEKKADLPPQYVTYGGEVYDKMPPSFKAAQKHSDSYIKAQQQEIFKEKLTSAQRGAFEELLAFKTQVQTCGRLYAALKDEERGAKDLSSFKESLEEATKERDFLAYKIVHSFERYSPLLERADVALCQNSQDQLLKYAVYGEVRQIALKYTLSKTVERRLELADQLHKMMSNAEGNFDKGLYGRVKGLGIDMARLRFEQGCLDVIRHGKEPLHFETVAELSAAFTNLETYRKVQHEVAHHWTIIKAHAVEKVVVLQTDQLSSLNALITEQKQEKVTSQVTLSREVMEEKALEILKSKDPANTQVLSTITREITNVVNGLATCGLTTHGATMSDSTTSGSAISSTPFPPDIQSRQVELMDIQSHLRKGPSGYVGIYNRDRDRDLDLDQNQDQSKNKYIAWEELREKRVSLATSTLEKYREVIKTSFAHDYKQMEKDAYEHHIGQVIKAYQNASGEQKAELAATILGDLDQENKNRMVKTQLKKVDVNFEALHLYGLYHHTSPLLEDKEKAFQCLERYVAAQIGFSSLWKPRSEVIEKELGAVKEQFNFEREGFISQLESRNPTRSCSFVVDRLIDEAQGLMAKAETSPKSIERTLQERLQEQDRSFEWRLTKEDINSLSRGLIELSHSRNQIHEIRLEAMKNTHFENDADFFKAALDRNEAAFNLMESPLGKAIEDSSHIFSVKGYAERYGGRQEKAQESHSPTTDEKMAAYPMLPFINRKEVVESALKENIADFADHIFASIGEDFHKGSSSVTQRRYGKNGHISVNLRTGGWINFKDSDLSGGPLHMLTKLKNLSFKEALEYGASWARLPPEQFSAQKKSFETFHAQRVEKETLAKESEAKEVQQKIERAQKLWAKGQSIQGTIAERYLKEHRKIEGKLPEDFRYLSNVRVSGEQNSGKTYPCLMIAARSNTGDITAVQLTFLDAKTANKADIPVQKRSYGLLKGSAVTVQAGKDSNYLFIAEGLETALSLKEAGLQGTIKASLGLANIGRIEPQDPKTHIVICGDHDDSKSPATKSLQKSVHTLQERGFKVSVIKPNTLGEDFNDVLKKQGIEGVRKIIKQTVPQALTQPIVITKEASALPKDVFNQITKSCEKILYTYIAKENISITPELKERIPLQADRAANFIFYAHTLSGTTPTEKETKQFLARAKYELDRIPHIKEKLTNEWQKRGKFDEQKDPLLIHMIAERQASIEGRLFLEAKQEGLKPPSNLPQLAEVEFKAHRAEAKTLAQELSINYSLSKNTATECAKNILRHQETHGAKPTDTQMTAMAEIAHQIEEKYPDYMEKDLGSHNLLYLRRMNADSMFRERCYENKHTIAHEQDMLKMQEKALIEVQKQRIEQEVSRQRDFSMSM